MFSHIDSLIGRRFTASIGEPWNFVSSIGKNLLEGEICGISLSANNQPRLLCNVSKFEVSGKAISQVLAVNRYIGSQDIFNAILSKQGATVNILYIKTGNKINNVEDLTLYIDSAEIDFLVGTIHLL